MNNNCFDVAVIGGGIIGIATAYFVSKRFKTNLVLLEKEKQLATHQTGRNSGVIHSGVYYGPGSQKAKFCTSGRESLYRFCSDNEIEFKRCGKIIVATNKAEESRLQRLYEFGAANGLRSIKILSKREFKKIEPNAAGLAALHVPDAGIVRYSEVTNRLAELAIKNGCEIRLNSELLALESIGHEQLSLSTRSGNIQTRFLINCSGLHADRTARICGVRSDVQIIPFRGEYFTVSENQSNLVNGLIYPVPDPSLPFLGVHFTKKLNGAVEIGPNALFATGRNAYQGFRLSQFPDLTRSLSFPGFWKLAYRHWRTGANELYRSINSKAMLAEIQKLVPAIERQHIRKSHSGIRAQAVSSSGELLNDFLLETSSNSIHVLNAPSPAATASLAIGKHITEIVDSHFNLPKK